LRKSGRAGPVRLVREDASTTSFPDGTFDAATMAFGIRNTEDVPRTLREMSRILKPGGVAVILEFSLPANRLIRRCYLTYLRRAVPLIGSLLSGDNEAYRYLNESIEGFYHGNEFLSLMRRTGFTNVTAVPLTFGVASIYSGTNRATDA
jgi:demethylmenaquinone methyltransferase/2-methoxy-6-polyprenyl-1,4-benzoquinol methylase